MAIDRSKFRTSLICSVTILGGNIVSGVLANLIVYGLMLGVPKIFAPDYKAILIGVIIAVIMGMAIYLLPVKKVIPEKYHVKSAIVSGILLGIVIGQVISAFPIFQITSPKDNSAVDHVISVRGCGGIPNSEIQVFVITDDIYPQDKKSHPDATGKWSVFPVFIGGAYHDWIEAEIYAEMTTPDGNVYKSNFVRVKRKQRALKDE